MSDLSLRIADLSPEKRELLLRRLSQKQADVARPQIDRQPRDSNIFPLSPAQQRLWFLDRLDPGSAVYNIPAAVRLSGVLQLGGLERSLNEIVRRHETLRTTFAMVHGSPAQIIAPERTIPLPLIDLPAPTGEAEMQRLLAAEAQRPFDLSHGPLIRTTLLRLGAQEHVLLLTMHHIVSDGWSLRVFVRELAPLYAAFIAGEPAPLAELPIQYADFAVWQHAWLQGSGVGGQGPGVRGQESGVRSQESGVRSQESDVGASQIQNSKLNTQNFSPNPQSPIPNPQSPLQAQLAYWKQQLAGAPAVLDLPTDRLRAPVRTFRGARQALLLPRPLAEALQALSRQEKASLFMTLLSAFQVLLQRYTGQDEIVVGAPIAGRTRPEIEPLIGFFLNTLVLHTSLSGTPTFRELLRRTRETCLGAYAHQDMPFEKLLEELQPERDLSHTPLFQVFFNMLNFPDTRFELPGLTLEVLDAPEIGAKFDLTLYVEEQPEGIKLDLVYNADLFEAVRMAELLEQFRQLLSNVAQRPDEQISSFSLVTPTAQARLPDPTEALDATWRGAIHQAFSQQARRTPQQPAVMDSFQSWTYAELDAHSNRLAHYLIAQDIRPQDVVAIYAHRSATLLWALLGVLKAGAAFMILDPAYPAARLIDYMTLAQPRGWVQLAAAGALPNELEQFVAASTWRCRIELPQHGPAAAWSLLADYSTDDPCVTVGPDDTACVTFTSGSAGRPKGILGRHGPLTHFLPWQSQAFRLNASDRFSMVSGLSHDPLQRDIFTPLWLGATICIPDPQLIGTPGGLAAWMQQQQITIAHLTPALGQLLTETPGGTDPALSSLRYAFIVGDVLTRRDVARIRQLAPAVVCVNFYGSTETQRAVGYYIVPDEALAGDDGPSQERQILPLGHGMPDVQLLVLNAAQQLAGVGEVGEIYVRSPHLAGGYIGDEALTRERFIEEGMRDKRSAGGGLGWGMVGSSPSPIPHPPSPGTRLYRTGDLGRYRPDGDVEFFGRADLQVKIRSSRVEPGEIEAVLSQHPAVRDAVVVAREDTPGERRLVAYIVQGSGVRDQGSEDGVLIPDPRSLIPDLRGFLRTKLPDYMVPAAFVLLEALPLTPNGKIDRAALPQPASLHGDSPAVSIAPQTELECMIAAVWQEVLHVAMVGVDDNFFDLGGSSIHVVQVHSKLHHALGREVPMLDMFKYPTVGSLAKYLTQEQREPPAFQHLQDRIQKQKAAIEGQRQPRYRPSFNR